jgi:RimJ/RimL family protein N-acetyltransferase
LRAFAGDEAPELTRLVARNLCHLMPWMPWAAEPPTLEANEGYVRRTMEEWNASIGFAYWMREDESGEMVGCAGLHARPGPGALEVGYWVSRDRVRRGYATASARALTTVALGIPSISRVEIHCDEANVASASVPKRLGYRLDRIEDERADAPGETGRTMIWVVGTETWVTSTSSGPTP